MKLIETATKRFLELSKKHNRRDAIAYTASEFIDLTIIQLRAIYHNKPIVKKRMKIV